METNLERLKTVRADRLELDPKIANAELEEAKNQDNVTRFQQLESRVQEIAQSQAKTADMQQRNYVDIWEPKKFGHKAKSFCHNTYEMWMVLWISAISFI